MVGEDIKKYIFLCSITLRQTLRALDVFFVQETPLPTKGQTYYIFEIETCFSIVALNFTSAQGVL